VCLEMFSKSCRVHDRSEIFRKLVPCVWAGVGKSPFSELRRQPWLDVLGIVNKYAVVSVLWTLPSSSPKCFLLCLLYSFERN